MIACLPTIAPGISSPTASPLGSPTESQPNTPASPISPVCSSPDTYTRRERPKLTIDLSKIEDKYTWGLPTTVWREMPQEIKGYTFMTDLQLELGLANPARTEHWILKLQDPKTGMKKVLKISRDSREANVIGVLSRARDTATNPAYSSPYLMYPDLTHIGTRYSFILMPYYDKTLFDYVNDYCATGYSGLPPYTTIVMARQILHALQAMNLCGFIHADIKPENILVSDNGECILFDFDKARMIDEEEPGYVFGTMEYMPPEGFHECSEVHPSYDIWSLATTVYKCLYPGNQPFSRRALVSGEVRPAFPLAGSPAESDAHNLLGKMFTVPYLQRITGYHAQAEFRRIMHSLPVAHST